MGNIAMLRALVVTLVVTLTLAACAKPFEARQDPGYQAPLDCKKDPIRSTNPSC